MQNNNVADSMGLPKQSVDTISDEDDDLDPETFAMIEEDERLNRKFQLNVSAPLSQEPNNSLNEKFTSSQSTRSHFLGFELASGKKITVNAEKLKQAFVTFEKEDFKHVASSKDDINTTVLNKPSMPTNKNIKECLIGTPLPQPPQAHKTLPGSRNYLDTSPHVSLNITKSHPTYIAGESNDSNVTLGKRRIDFDMSSIVTEPIGSSPKLTYRQKLATEIQNNDDVDDDDNWAQDFINNKCEALEHEASTKKESGETDMNSTWVSLESGVTKGSDIGNLLLVVTHVYEMVFVDFNQPTKEFRNKKQQHRIQQKLDIKNKSLLSAITNQVEEEMYQEQLERVIAIKKLKVDIENLTAVQVCDLMDTEKDVTNVGLLYRRITLATEYQIEEVRRERSRQLNKLIRKKLDTSEDYLSQILRFRVVDAVAPTKTSIVNRWSPNEKDLETAKSGIVSYRSPTDELIELITKGQVIEITQAKAQRLGENTQINIGSRGLMRAAHSDVPLKVFEPYFRRDTKINNINSSFNPPHNEFDVACVVIRIEAVSEKGTQRVFVADGKLNIMCINFPSSLNENAFDDDVVEEAVLFVSNLQWRASHSSNEIPQAFVIHNVTLFTARPTCVTQLLRLEEIENDIWNTVGFAIKCNIKIDLPSSAEKNNSIVHPVYKKYIRQPKREEDDKPPRSRQANATVREIIKKMRPPTVFYN